MTNNLILAWMSVKGLLSSRVTFTLRLILNHKILIGHRRTFQAITEAAHNSLKQTFSDAFGLFYNLVSTEMKHAMLPS